MHNISSNSLMSRLRSYTMLHGHNSETQIVDWTSIKTNTHTLTKILSNRRIFLYLNKTLRLNIGKATRKSCINADSVHQISTKRWWITRDINANTHLSEQLYNATCFDDGISQQIMIHNLGSYLRTRPRDVGYISAEASGCSCCVGLIRLQTVQWNS